MLNKLAYRWKHAFAFWLSTFATSRLLGLFALILSAIGTYEPITWLLRVVPGPWRSNAPASVTACLVLAFLLFPTVLTEVSELGNEPIRLRKP